jgi:hypothetical protein
MTKYESDKISINCPAEKIFTFLSDFNNFGKLMPEQATNWKATQDTCSFSIQNMAQLAMRITEKTPFSKLVYSSESPSPFEFTLTTNLEIIADNQCTSMIVFDANINPMMNMMLQRPLQNFVNILNQKLKQTFETN